MKLTFWGAAQVVTGSMHQLIVGDGCYLLDCGEYQGHRKEASHRNGDDERADDEIEHSVVSA